MDIDKECSALGGLFQTIINDMKTSSPVWEDFLQKATKLHTALRGTITAASAFLETFQKVADVATNTKGATREIGSALTRLCMRHRSIEAKLKAFTQSIMEMVNPLQDKMDEWKKTCVHLDKEHAKEYKKARQEIKRASSDTVRLQKKVKKASISECGGKQDMQLRLDHALQDVNDKFMILEETEKSSVRTALIEERSRFCLFVSYFKPVVDEEIAMLTEVTHLQEIVDQLCMLAGDPAQLPEASEQLLQDVKTTEGTSFQFQTPPSSPSSLGSRKSSMCSINSINSSSSGSSKSHSPCHQLRHRNSAQPLNQGTIRLSSVSSQDSGFTSQDTLYLRPHTPQPNTNRQSSLVETSNTSLASSTSSGVNQSSSVSDIAMTNINEGSRSSNSSGDNTNTNIPGTWTNWPTGTDITSLERPHTISTAYERSHSRPALTAHTFEPPPPSTSQTAPATPNPYAVPCLVPSENKSDPNVSNKPPVKIYERSSSVGAAPQLPKTPNTAKKMRPVMGPTVPDFSVPHQDQSKKSNVIPQPVYVNMNELATMAAAKHKEVELRRNKSVPGSMVSEGSNGSENSPASIVGGVSNSPTVTPHAGQRNQRSMSMPANTEDMSPLSEALEGLNSEMSSGPHAIQSKYQGPDSTELAAAIKDLEASTAALQMTYENNDIEDKNADEQDGSIRRSSMHKPSPPVRRNSSLGGMMPTSSIIEAAAAIQPPSTRSGSNTPTPQPSPNSIPKAQHQQPTVINLNSIMPQQKEVIYMQPHFHVSQQQQQNSNQPLNSSHYMSTQSQYQQSVPQSHYQPSLSGGPSYTAQTQSTTIQQPTYQQPTYQQQQPTYQQPTYQQPPLNKHNVHQPPAATNNSSPYHTPHHIPHVHNGNQPNEDSTDGCGFWPPPPPPVQESDYAELDAIQMQINVAGGIQPGMAQSGRPSSIGHIQSSHGSIIQSLNAKLSAQPNRIPGAPANLNGADYSNNSTLSYSSDDVTPTAEPPRDSIGHH